MIEPWNPDILEVSSTGPAASVHDVKMGIYTKIEGISINENNVWKHASGRQFIYFMNNVWMIGSDYSNSISGIKTKDKDNMMISDNTWLYYNEDEIWHDDDGSILVKEYYPGKFSFTSSTIGTSSEAPEWIGIYKQVPNLIKNKKPVWKNTNLEYYLHYTVGKYLEPRTKYIYLSFR